MCVSVRERDREGGNKEVWKWLNSRALPGERGRVSGPAKGKLSREG